MKEYIKDRVSEVANYIVNNKATVRQAAKHFKTSKSTIHNDMTSRIKEACPSLMGDVREVLDFNKSERHIRGGLATRERYRNKQDKQDK